MPRVKASVSDERERAVLTCVRSHLTGSEGAVVSIANIASETALAAHQARAALQRLVRKGALSVTARSYPNGASAENSYRITPVGFALFETAEHTTDCEQLSQG